MGVGVSGDVGGEYITFSHSKLIEELSTPQHHQKQQLYHHHQVVNNNTNSFESVDLIEKQIGHGSHTHFNSAQLINSSVKNLAHHQCDVTSQQSISHNSKRNSIGKAQIEPASKLLHLPPIPYIKHQQTSNLNPISINSKSSTQQIHQIHINNSTNNSSSNVNINMSTGGTHANSNSELIKLNGEYSNKSLNYAINASMRNQHQQTESFCGEKKNHSKNNLASYAIQNEMYYKTIATQTHMGYVFLFILKER